MTRTVRILGVAVVAVSLLGLVGPSAAARQGRHHREQAQVFVAWRGTLDEAGRATITVFARCRPPWAVAILQVDLFQFPDRGSGDTDDYLRPCDGRWFRRNIQVTSTTGTFDPGRAFAHASLQILDPTNGDPVDTVHAVRRVWLFGSVAEILWDQTGQRSGARTSTDMPDDTLDSQGADDFVVPAGQVWSISTVFAPGSNGSSHPEPFLIPGVNVTVYADAGGAPGAVVASYPSVPPTTLPDDLTIPISPALSLSAGTYWISVQADLSSLTIFDSWGWATRNATTGATGVWRNPGGGFGGPTDWAPERDWEFDLRGTSSAA
jgi:hypothetical protein